MLDFAVLNILKARGQAHTARAALVEGPGKGQRVLPPRASGSFAASCGASSAGGPACPSSLLLRHHRISMTPAARAAMPQGSDDAVGGTT